MSSSSQSGKKRAKKSGAGNRRIKKKQKKENEVLSSYMRNYLMGESIDNDRGQEEVYSGTTLMDLEVDASISSVDDDTEPLNFETGNVDITDEEVDEMEKNMKEKTARNISDYQNDEEEILPANYSRKFDVNPNIIVDKSNNTFDPVSLVGLKLTNEEMPFLLKMEPCQPSENILKKRCKKQGDRMRHCSQDIF